MPPIAELEALADAGDHRAELEALADAGDHRAELKALADAGDHHTARPHPRRARSRR